MEKVRNQLLFLKHNHRLPNKLEPKWNVDPQNYGFGSSNCKLGNLPYLRSLFSLTNKKQSKIGLMFVKCLVGIPFCLFTASLSKQRHNFITSPQFDTLILLLTKNAFEQVFFFHLNIFFAIKAFVIVYIYQFFGIMYSKHYLANHDHVDVEQISIAKYRSRISRFISISMTNAFILIFFLKIINRYLAFCVCI